MVETVDLVVVQVVMEIHMEVEQDREILDTLVQQTKHLPQVVGVMMVVETYLYQKEIPLILVVISEAVAVVALLLLVCQEKQPILNLHNLL